MGRGAVVASSIVGVLAGFLAGYFGALHYLAYPVANNPVINIIVLVGGVLLSFFLGLIVGRGTAKTPRTVIRGERVFEEPAAIALVEIALKRYGGRSE